jgi:Bacterial Ig-like domain (group 2)/Lactonase, 7-bladed beta-propeller
MTSCCSTSVPVLWNDSVRNKTSSETCWHYQLETVPDTEYNVDESLIPHTSLVHKLIAEFRYVLKFKRPLQILSLLLLVGLSSCLGSAVSNLFVKSTKLTPANPTIAVGATQQFILNETYLDGTTDQEPPNHTTWASDNPAVATIDKTGVATGVAAGTANIAGSHDGNNANTTLTVTAAEFAVISVEGNARLLRAKNLRTGQQMTFATNGLRDSVTAWSSGDSAATAEVSVLPEHGPEWLAIAPSGDYLYVANQISGSVSAFAIDWKTGGLKAIVSSPFSVGAKPSSIEIEPDGATLTVTHLENPAITRLRIDLATGALTLESR